MRQASPAEEAALLAAMARIEPVVGLPGCGCGSSRCGVRCSETARVHLAEPVYVDELEERSGPTSGPRPPVLAPPGEGEGPVELTSRPPAPSGAARRCCPPSWSDLLQHSDVFDARLNCSTGDRRRSVGSPVGTTRLPCVVCCSDVPVNAVFCVECAFMAPLVRRHFSTRVLQLGDDDE